MMMITVFFFQAEDGIRDKLVTGVQTCALPIWLVWAFSGSGLGQESDQERAGGMARIEDWNLLPAGASGADGEWAGNPNRQAVSALAGGADRTGPEIALGGDSRRFRASQGEIGVGRWHCLDLESENRPLV